MGWAQGRGGTRESCPGSDPVLALRSIRRHQRDPRSPGSGHAGGGKRNGGPCSQDFAVQARVSGGGGRVGPRSTGRVFQPRLG